MRVCSHTHLVVEANVRQERVCEELHRCAGLSGGAARRLQNHAQRLRQVWMGGGKHRVKELTKDQVKRMPSCAYAKKERE